jgi:hypothetical protein
MIKVAAINPTMLILAAVGAGIAHYLVTRGTAAALNAITPTNRNNIFASGVNAVGESLTGDGNWSLGSAWYDKCSAEGFGPWYCPNPKN